MHAFGRLGGVPLVQVRYGNLKPAVPRVLFGRSRAEFREVGGVLVAL